MFCCNDTAKKVAGVFFILLNGAQGVFLLWVYLTRHDIGYHDVIKDFKDIFGCFSAKGRYTIGNIMFDFYSFTIQSFRPLRKCNYDPSCDIKGTLRLNDKLFNDVRIDIKMTLIYE